MWFLNFFLWWDFGFGFTCEIHFSFLMRFRFGFTCEIHFSFLIWTSLGLGCVCFCLSSSFEIKFVSGFENLVSTHYLIPDTFDRLNTITSSRLIEPQLYYIHFCHKLYTRWTLHYELEGMCVILMVCTSVDACLYMYKLLDRSFLQPWLFCKSDFVSLAGFFLPANCCPHERFEFWIWIWVFILSFGFEFEFWVLGFRFEF